MTAADDSKVCSLENAIYETATVVLVLISYPIGKQGSVCQETSECSYLFDGASSSTFCWFGWLCSSNHIQSFAWCITIGTVIASPYKANRTGGNGSLITCQVQEDSGRGLAWSRFYNRNTCILVFCWLISSLKGKITNSAESNLKLGLNITFSPRLYILVE